MSQSDIVELINGYLALLDETFTNPVAEQLSTEFLQELISRDRSDILALSCVRYLFHMKRWPLSGQYSNKSQWGEVLEYFYSSPNHKVPEDYIALTRAIIQDVFQFSIPDPIPTVVLPKATKPTKKNGKSSGKTSKTTATNEEGESGSKTFKTLAQMET